MSTRDERDLLAEYSTAVAAYLNTMAATADCLEQTYPDVGGPYRQRIHRLRSRVAFDATRDAIRSSEQALGKELKDYAAVANRVLTERDVELKSGLLTLSETIENLARREDAFGEQLRQLAQRVENLPFTPDSHTFALETGEQAAALRALADRMTHETANILSEMRQEAAELDQRLAGASCTDPVTGLINRRELERQIEAHKLHGSTFCLLFFELIGPISDQVLRMAAAKLNGKFRPHDWIGRWGPHEFAVLFLAGPEQAHTRATHVAELLGGSYTLHNGEKVLMSAKARVTESEVVLV